jgi:hypothetical protein
VVLRSGQSGPEGGHRVEKGQAVERRTMTAEASLAYSKTEGLQIVMIHHKHRSTVLAVQLSYSGYTKAPRDHISVFAVYIHSTKGSCASAFLGSDVSWPSETSKSELEEQRTALSRT